MLLLCNWWHILPACNHDPKCKSIMWTSGNNIAWILMAQQWKKFIIACCLPLALIVWSVSSLSHFWGFQQAWTGCFSSILWLIFNYSISTSICSWPTLLRAPYFGLLQFIKLFFGVFFFVISGWRERHRLVYGSKNKKMLCHLALGFKIWWHRGRDLNRAVTV